MIASYPFIFSKKYRFRRHFLFWFCWWAFESFLYSFTPLLTNTSDVTRFSITCTEAFLYLIPHMFLAYALMYFVVPELLLKNKYLLTFISVIILFLLTASISAFVGIYILKDMREFLLGDNFYADYSGIKQMSFFRSLLAGLRGGITIGGMAAAIKLMKILYLKEQRNLQLQKENTESQLQLLKAQVHPHFLFNTLNNIYALARKKSDLTADAVMKLSKLLRFMLYDAAKPLITIGDEIRLLEDYIDLEKIRYNDRMVISFLKDVSDEQELISPLLLLPFVENAFKHGASESRFSSYIYVDIKLHNGILKFSVKNTKENNNQEYSGENIGLNNVKRQLELLYKEYDIQVLNEASTFLLSLTINLKSYAKNNLSHY